MNSIISFKCCVRIHSHLACTLTMCYVLITMICFLFLFFCHYIDYLFVSVCFFCCVCDFWQPFLFFMYLCMKCACACVCVYMFVYCFTTPVHAPTHQQRTRR